MVQIIDILPVIGILVVGLLGYIKGRSDSYHKQVKRENKVLREYDKISNEKVTRNEVYKKKKW